VFSVLVLVALAATGRAEGGLVLALVATGRHVAILHIQVVVLIDKALVARSTAPAMLGEEACEPRQPSRCMHSTAASRLVGLFEMNSICSVAEGNAKERGGV